MYSTHLEPCTIVAQQSVAPEMAVTQTFFRGGGGNRADGISIFNCSGFVYVLSLFLTHWDLSRRLPIFTVSLLSLILAPPQVYDAAPLRTNATYINVYINWLYLVFMYLLPFVCLAVFNLLIYREVSSGAG